MAVILGIENLIQQNFSPLKGKRVGLMSNPSAVTRKLRSTYDIVATSDKVNLSALFAPEHGFAATAQDGERVETIHDKLTGVPIYSLYGTSYRPTEDMLADIDVMVCDIQDIGVRYYTFMWTITHIIEACAEVGLPVIILDRPNPLGDTVAGRGLEPYFASLVGRYDIPIQHGMTLGEITQLINHEHSPSPCDLTVIPCQNYQRDMTWQDTGLVFVPPSPNMPHLVTVQHYPGACFIEGTTLSEGRGTTLPFEIVGAPFIDAEKLASALNHLDLGGVRFRAHTFTPTISKFSGKICHGVQAHITDSKGYHPIETWAQVLWVLKRAYSNQIAWHDSHIDRLAGDVDLRDCLDSGSALADLLHEWERYSNTFREQRQPYLIY